MLFVFLFRVANHLALIANHLALTLTSTYLPVQECVASLDADLLKKATAGIGTDERMVVNIMCSRTKAQLDAVDMIYRERYHRSLREYCERELSGDIEEFLVYTQMDEDEADAHMIHKAFSGIGHNSKVVLEVFIGRTSKRLQDAR
jgi:annexin A7/11